MDCVIVCKPAWWGTSSRIPDTAGYMAGTAQTTKLKTHKDTNPETKVTRIHY